MIGEQLWKLAGNRRELQYVISSRPQPYREALEIVANCLCGYRAKGRSQPQLARRQMHEQLPSSMQRYYFSPEELLSALRQAYYADQQVLDQAVLDFLFDTNQLELLLDGGIYQWFKLSEYDLKDLLHTHYFRGDLSELMVRANKLLYISSRLSQLFEQSVNDILMQLFDEKRAQRYCSALFLDYQALQAGRHPFSRCIAEFKALQAFLTGSNVFLLYVKPREQPTLEPQSPQSEIDFTHVLAWFFDFQHKIQFDPESVDLSQFCSPTHPELEQLDPKQLNDYIGRIVCPQIVTQHVKSILTAAFSRCNGQNVSMYAQALSELHCCFFLHAAFFYAEKLLLTDLGDMLFAVLTSSARESPLLCRAFVLAVLRTIDFDCFAKGRIAKSMQNAVVFVVKLCDYLKFNDYMQYLISFFELKIFYRQVLAVFGLREIIFRVFGQSQKKSVDSVQISQDLAVFNPDVANFTSIKLENPARLILHLNHANFAHYYEQANCIVDELSDMITLLRNDLLYIYQGVQFSLDFELDATNELNPLILPACWAQRAKFDKSVVLYFGYIYGLTQYYPNTILDDSNITLISMFVYLSPRQYHRQIAQFISYHLENGRKKEVCTVVRNIIMHSITWTKNDADRIGDFFIDLFQLFNSDEMMLILLEIITYYMIVYAENINAVQALYLALKFQDIEQFSPFFAIIQRIVRELYCEVDDNDSVLLRSIVQQFNKKQSSAVWNRKAVDCYILSEQQITEEFCKWVD